MIFGKKEKSQVAKSGEYSIYLNTGVPLAAKKRFIEIMLWASTLSWCDPRFVFAQLWRCLTNLVSQCCQNFQTVSLVYSIDLIVSRPLIGHLSLYMPLKPRCDKKISLIELVYIINQRKLATKLAEDSVFIGNSL